MGTQHLHLVQSAFHSGIFNQEPFVAEVSFCTPCGVCPSLGFRCPQQIHSRCCPGCPKKKCHAGSFWGWYVCVCLGCYCLHHVQHVILGSDDFVYRWFYMFYPKLSVAILWSDQSSIWYCCRSYLCQGLLIMQWCCLKKNDHLQHVDVMPWNKEHAMEHII